MTKLPTPPPEPTDDTPSEEWIEGFEAASDWNADKRLRLECVQAAVSGKMSGEDYLAKAREIYQFVIGATCAVCGGALDHGEDDEPDAGTVQ